MWCLQVHNDVKSWLNVDRVLDFMFLSHHIIVERSIGTAVHIRSLSRIMQWNLVRKKRTCLRIGPLGQQVRVSCGEDVVLDLRH